MKPAVEALLEDRNDFRSEIAREVVQQAADLEGDLHDDEDLLTIFPRELEAIVRRVLAQFGIS